MTLTLKSSTSFINLRESKGLRKPQQFFKSSVYFTRIIRSPCNVKAKITIQGSDKIPIFEMKNYEKEEKIHRLSISRSKIDSRVPVFVMLPLDTVLLGGNLNKPRAMNASLMALKSAGIEGVMVDAWWGLVEKDGPLKYNWEGYAELVAMVQKHGLKLQVVMSFHQCGGNVGDSCK